jgi:hypothetical protein
MALASPMRSAGIVVHPPNFNLLTGILNSSIDWHDPGGETLHNRSSAGSLVFCFSLVDHLVALILSSPRTPVAASGAGLGARSPIKPVRPAARILARGPIAKRAVRTAFIVFDTPALEDHARFVQIAEEFAVQAFHREACRESSQYARFPKGSRASVKRLDPLGLQSVLHAGGDKLRPVVAARYSGTP